MACTGEHDVAQDYLLGDIVLSGAGQYIEAVTPGKSSGTEPSFNPLRSSTTIDNEVVWLNWGLTPPSTYTLWSEISAHELSGGGYPAGGVALTNPVLTLARRRVTWSIDDIDFGTLDGYEFYLNMGSLRAGAEKYGLSSNPHYMINLDHTTYDDFWKARSIWRHFSKLTPAVLTVGGWFDAEDLQGPLRTYRQIALASPATSNRGAATCGSCFMPRRTSFTTRRWSRITT